VRCTLVIVGVLLGAPAAFAFPTGGQFDSDPLTTDGSGGIAFTGSPRFQGHSCAVCHTDPPGLIGIKLESDHPELFDTGWVAQKQYHLRVVLENQHAAAQFAAAGDNCGFAVTPYTPCDQNGFALEMDDVVGGAEGKFTAVVNGACATGTPPTDADVVVLKDGSAVVHNGAHHGQTKWDFCWTAPGAGTGVITAYLAAVDGNGGTGSEAYYADTINDDVAAGAVPIGEAGGQPPLQSGGCSAGGGGGLVLVALVIFACASSRRGPFALRRRRLLAVLAMVALVGCTHVRPRQRETLAKKKMMFSPDPTEDELDLHMQEAREGSSGGYGSSGGGCGCN